MVFNKRKILIIFTTLLIISSLFLTSFATEETVDSREENGLICISYRGDTAEYPENSLEALLSAQQKGADMISVGVDKTADGVYVLAEKKKLSDISDSSEESVNEVTYSELNKLCLKDNSGQITPSKILSLETALETVSVPLIIDIDWAERDGVYELLSSTGNLGRVHIRTFESARVIEEWVAGKSDKVSVIGVYDGNIIFNAISHFNKMSDLSMPFVQFQSKNYFNVIFGGFFCGRFVYDNAPVAVASTYDLDLSGQRYDSAEGWNDLIELGYTAIETNNLASFTDYRDSCEKMKKALGELVEREENSDIASASSTTLKNRVDALKLAKNVLSGGVSSLEELQRAYSSLLLAMNENNIDSETDTQKGHLNITAGKIIAAVVVGAAILAAQIFVHKMQEEKRRK